MIRALEGPRRVGDVWIGAVVETAVWARALKGGYQGAGIRRPVALAIFDGEVLLAFSGTGAPMTEADLDSLCPGSAAQLRAAAGDGSP